MDGRQGGGIFLVLDDAKAGVTGDDEPRVRRGGRNLAHVVANVQLTSLRVWLFVIRVLLVRLNMNRGADADELGVQRLL